MLLPNESSKLLKLTNDSCRGIIWLHKGDLNLAMPYFEDLNYLSNGLLAQSIDSKSKTNMFHASNFGKSFYIFSCDIEQSDINKKVDSFTKLIKQIDFEKENFIILEPESSHLGKNFKSQYSKIKFSILHY